MGTRFSAAVCPLCTHEFENPDLFRQHLAVEHELHDDPGTETTLGELPPEPEPVVAPEPELAPVVPAEAPADHTRHGARHDRRAVFGAAGAIAVLLVVGLIALMGSGGDSDDRRDVTAAGASRQVTPTPSPAPPADPQADQARAEQIVPRIEDLPAGWAPLDLARAVASGEATKFGACPTPADSYETATALVAFQGSGSIFSGGSSIFDTEAHAMQEMTEIRSTALPCLATQAAAAIRTQLPRGAKLTSGTFSPLPFPSYGDESIAQSIPFTALTSNTVGSLRLDLVLVRRGRELVGGTIAIPANQFTPTQEQALLAAVAERMSAGRL
jgi:hypothetical protein